MKGGSNGITITLRELVLLVCFFLPSPSIHEKAILLTQGKEGLSEEQNPVIFSITESDPNIVDTHINNQNQSAMTSNLF